MRASPIVLSNCVRNKTLSSSARRLWAAQFSERHPPRNTPYCHPEQAGRPGRSAHRDPPLPVRVVLGAEGAHSTLPARLYLCARLEAFVALASALLLSQTLVWLSIVADGVDFTPRWAARQVRQRPRTARSDCAVRASPIVLSNCVRNQTLRSSARRRR